EPPNVCQKCGGPGLNEKIPPGFFLSLPFSKSRKQPPPPPRRYYIALFNPFCFIDSNPEDASHFYGVIF
ncbi:hypothetical protein, partial [Escherichia coli]|uniref:hypothetical protein n=1 Tax=Escherichia coli TaxID=562 RepID=UPI001BCACE92